MSFNLKDIEEAEKFTKLISSASFNLTGIQLIEAYKSLAWFTVRVCERIKSEVNQDGKKSEPKQDGRARGRRRGALSGHGGNEPNGNQSGSEPSPESPSTDDL
jgi:hypothetical protein